MAAGERLCSNRFFVMLALPRLEHHTAETQFGFVVSKKVHKRAHERNRIKRRFRELVRKTLIQYKPDWLKRYISVILIARSESVQATYRDLELALSKGLENRC